MSPSVMPSSFSGEYTVWATRQVKNMKRKPRGKTGWGGAWRAYVRLRSLGSTGMPVLADLAKKYAEAKETRSEEFRLATRLGQVARLRAKQTVISASSSAFGPKGKVVRRAGLKALRQSLQASVAHLAPESRALAVGARLVAQGVTVQESLSLARSTLRASSLQDRQRHAATLEELANFENGVGAGWLSNLRADIPSLGATPLRPIPHCGAHCFSAQSPSQEDVAHAVGWAEGNRSTNLSVCLEETWKELHQIILADFCESTGGTNDLVHSPCIDAGMCICSEEGKQLDSFRNQFLKAMKKVFVPGSQQRLALLSGKVAVRLVREHQETIEEGRQTVYPAKVVWLFIGLMYFSPYRPTFMRLEEGDAVDVVADSPDRLYVKANGSIVFGVKSQIQQSGCSRPHETTSVRTESRTHGLSSVRVHYKITRDSAQTVHKLGPRCAESF